MSMTKEKGNLSIHTENILPIIKKWLYSDKEIFIRELISNAVDANEKLKQLSLIGDYKEELGELFVEVTIDKEKKILTFSDNGIGLTAEEIKKYINQIAFSGAEEFLEKYKDNKEENQIIGHFGLGFYSAFMVSEKVEIISKTYQDQPATHWINEGGIEFSIEEGDRKERGTDVILHISAENEEFLDAVRVRAVIEKYCNFLPYPIKLNGSVINDQHPLWLKSSRETKDEEYKEFYKKLFPMEQEPLFWIHLDVEVPFRLKGILFFPKLRHELDSSKGRIKLFCNQVFVSDNAKEIIPEFLTLLQGTLDVPDIPLNVSRSYLQNDPYVRKISEHITKKVADKLKSLFKKDREQFEKYWDDINIFVKYGLMNNDKFYDVLKESIIFKTTDQVYKTLEEYKEKNKGINKEKDGKQIVLYASDEKQQVSFINMIKSHGMEAIIFNSLIDVHFIQFLEMKDSSVSFTRIDSDTNDLLVEEESQSKIVDENNQTQDDKIKAVFDGVLNKGKDDEKDKMSKLNIKVQALKNDKTSSMIVFSEFMRRFKEMNHMYNRTNEEDLFTDHTLLVNSNNEIVKNIFQLHQETGHEEQIDLLVHQVYDLALLAQNQLKGDRLVNFIERTNSIIGNMNPSA